MQILINSFNFVLGVQEQINKMDPPSGSNDSALLGTSNLGFDTPLFEDQPSDTSSSLDEQHDPFDTQDEDTMEKEKKFVPTHTAGTNNEREKQPTIQPTESTERLLDRRPTNKSDGTFAIPKAQAPQKARKSIVDIFPWLVEVDKINQQCLGSMTELKHLTVLDAMDYLIG